MTDREWRSTFAAALGVLAVEAAHGAQRADGPVALGLAAGGAGGAPAEALWNARDRRAGSER